MQTTSHQGCVPLTLYGTGSSNVMKIVLMLEELGERYAFEHVRIWRGEQFEPPVSTLNPNCKVPILVDARQTGRQPVVVFESGAILIYLAEQAERFLPTHGLVRYEILQWLMLQVSGLGPAFGQHIHFTRFEPKASDYAQARYTSEAIRLADVFETQLADREYLCGDYSIADVAAYPWLCRLEELKLPADRPHIQRWCAQIAQRPAAARMEKRARELRKETAVLRSQASDQDLDRLFGRGIYRRRI